MTDPDDLPALKDLIAQALENCKDPVFLDFILKLIICEAPGK